MNIWKDWLGKRNGRTLESVAKDINDSLGRYGISALVSQGVIGVSKLFNENPPRRDTIMLEYFPNKQDPSMSYYDLHDSIGRRYKENQYQQMMQDIKNYFNQADL